MKQLILFSLLLTLAAPVMAQSQTSRQDMPKWWQNVTKQTIVLLDSPIPSVRAQALKNTIYLSKYHSDRISMDAAVRYIITVYEKDSDASVRKQALAALESIGSSNARRYIAANVPEEAAEETSELIASVLDELAPNSRSTL